MAANIPARPARSVRPPANLSGTIRFTPAATTQPITIGRAGPATLPSRTRPEK